MTTITKKLSGFSFAGLSLMGLATLFFSNPVFSAATQNYLMWQMPTTKISFPVYVYSGGKQVGYLYSVDQQAFIGPYDAATTTASYKLYYENGKTWYGCTVALKHGSINTVKTTCPGTVLNSPVKTSNVYTVGPGAIVWPAVTTAPVNPTVTDYGHRKITFINATDYPMIQVGEICTVSANKHNPNCANNENLFQISKGESKKKVFMVDDKKAEGKHFPAGLVSYGFTVTAYKDASGNIVNTGGYGSGNPYATKIELTSMPAPTVNGVQTPTGATNIDVSAVDGYNISVKVYPESAAYCTFTVPPENSNVLGVAFYDESNPLGQLSISSKLCKKSSQLPSGSKATAWNLEVTTKGDFLGCMSPCTYATKNSSSDADLFCCAGAYDTAKKCDQAKGIKGANNSTYVTNLKPPVSAEVYRFAYDDAVGDHACPAETNFIVKFLPSN